jgi:hypothetical protein
MIVMQLTGIVDLDATVRHNTGDNGNEDGGEISLHYVLPKHFRTKDGELPLFAEVHQRQANGPAEAVMPNAKLAEIMIVAMNKHMAGFLKHYLINRGLDPDSVTRLVFASCFPNLVVELNMVTWDSENNEVTTGEETDEDARLTVFEKATFLIRCHVRPIGPATETYITFNCIV